MESRVLLELAYRDRIYSISCINVAGNSWLRLHEAGRWPPRLAPIFAIMRP